MPRGIGSGKEAKLTLYGYYCTYNNYYSFAYIYVITTPVVTMVNPPMPELFICISIATCGFMYGGLALKFKSAELTQSVL